MPRSKTSVSYSVLLYKSILAGILQRQLPRHGIFKKTRARHEGLNGFDEISSFDSTCHASGGDFFVGWIGRVKSQRGGVCAAPLANDPSIAGSEKFEKLGDGL